MAIENVAIFGATGNLGTWILDALIAAKLFNVTILQRAESKSKIDQTKFPNTEIRTLPTTYWEKADELAQLLKGQDALVVVMPAASEREQQAFATACCTAKVQRMVPADFGSVDSSDQFCVDTIPYYYQPKKNVREALQALSTANTGFFWTAIVNGHFLDWGLENPLLGYDIKASPPTATIFDGGEIKWSASSRKRIGEAVVKVLSPEHEEATRNKLVYIESVNVTQNETLAALEKVSGQKFKVIKADSQEYIKARRHELDTGTGHDPLEELVGVLGVTRTNWQTKENYMNKQFGFSLDDIEEVARKAWENTHK